MKDETLNEVMDMFSRLPLQVQAEIINAKLSPEKFKRTVNILYVTQHLMLGLKNA